MTEMTIDEFYESAPLPEARDQFAVEDAERRLIRRLELAGYTHEEACVQVRAALRQIAVAWGLLPRVPVPPYSGTGPVSVAQGLEMRRSWSASGVG